MIPTEKQINKQKSILAEKAGHTALLSLEDVEELYENNKAIPEQEDEPYAIGFGKREVPKKDGEPGETEWQFFLIFTTRRLMNKQHESLILQTDATYKLNLLGYPVLVCFNYLLAYLPIPTRFRSLVFPMLANGSIPRPSGFAHLRASSLTRVSSMPSNTPTQGTHTIRR